MMVSLLLIIAVTSSGSCLSVPTLGDFHKIASSASSSFINKPNHDLTTESQPDALACRGGGDSLSSTGIDTAPAFIADDAQFYGDIAQQQHQPQYYDEEDEEEREQQQHYHQDVADTENYDTETAGDEYHNNSTDGHNNKNDDEDDEDVVQYNPSYPKSQDEYDFIYQALMNNVMFQSLSEESLHKLVHAFEKTVATKDDVEPIIRQGDPCIIETSTSLNATGLSSVSISSTSNRPPSLPTPPTYVYMLYNGYCNVYVDGVLVPEPYGTICDAGTIFGELGVFYERPRSATISAKSNTVTLFRIDGKIFQAILLCDDDGDTSGNAETSSSPSPSSTNGQDNSSKKTRSSSLPPPLVLQEIDDAINQVSGTSTYSKLYKGRIIRQYNPSRWWLYRRVRGTVLKQTYKTVLTNVFMSALVIVGTKLWVGATGNGDNNQWSVGLMPEPSHPFIQRLNIIRKVWNYQMSLTTFLLTFFMNHAYAFWYEIYDLARGIQGRLNDFQLLLATSTSRNPDGTYTAQSIQLLNDVGSFTRLFHILFWASSARRFSVLATPMGLQRLASRGMMTKSQLRVLQQVMSQSHVPPYNACFEWMMVRAWEGMADGTLRNDAGLSQNLLELSCRLRGTFASMDDKLEARMPLPYTHFVQILVDSFIALSPIALYPELGVYSIFCVAILTLFYSGLLDRKPLVKKQCRWSSAFCSALIGNPNWFVFFSNIFLTICYLY